MSYSSCSCFCLLDRTIPICVSCFRAVKIWFFEYNSLILTTGCSTWHLMAKNSLRIWELELLLSTKMAEAIRRSVTTWNWATVQWPGSYRGFPRRVSLGTGLARVDQRSWVLVLYVRCRSWLQKTDAWVLPALLYRILTYEYQVIIFRRAVLAGNIVITCQNICYSCHMRLQTSKWKRVQLFAFLLGHSVAVMLNICMIVCVSVCASETELICV